ncbi:hypothetical protein COY07_03225 [Candidatus Peregrinibacteria bacterium CG_4_10_14_0_2_um_filter_43_11]|nr:MAG: hypothetical protein COY07_03225 [Candidatus Peregrinibacteria bacterium CG_4_10_14_0_2_um_filter_43_11]
MKKTILKFYSFALLFFAFHTPRVLAVIFEGVKDPDKTDAQAGIGIVGDSLEGAGVTPQDGNLSNLILSFVNFALPYLALAAFIGYIYAGVLYVAAFGSEDMMGKSKKILMFSTIGLIIVILSYTIVNLLTSELTDYINVQ